MKRFYYSSLFLSVIFSFLSYNLNGQASFMMQGWYWDYPKTAANANWADTLRLKTNELGNAGFNFLWLPPLSRTASGPWSNGYDPKDLYDYGEYGQGATGFGARTDLDQLITALNGQNIKPVADLVYNHRDGGGVEDNPGLKNYVVNFFDADKINNHGANPFPYDRMRVVLPLGGSSGNGSGDYYFKFRSKSQHSKFHNWEYQIYMYTDKVGWQNLPNFNESEPNGGGNCSQLNNTISLGVNIHGNIDSDACGIDEFKLTLTTNDYNASGDAIYILFDKRYSGYSDLYIHGIWSAPRNQDIVNDLYYQTYTNYNYMPSGQGLMNWSNFKPNSTNTTYLAGDWDGMFFYYDYDQFQTDTKNKLFAWTRWNWSDVGIRGLRVDAIKHFSPEFMGDLLDNLYDNNMAPPMVVGEWYGTNTNELAGWVNSVYSYMDNDTKQAIAPKVFDFSLREALRLACDQYGYNVRGVFDSSIVDKGKLNGLNVVTFANNHDFRDGSGFASLIQNDAILAYAYILTNNQIGVPTVFYPDYFGYPQNGPGYHPPYKGGHKTAINQLMSIHNQYIYGSSTRTYLNKYGSGFINSAEGTNDQLLVYQLKGGVGFKNLVVAINFSGNRAQFSQQLDGIPVGTRLSDLTGNSAYPVSTVEASANGVPNSIWIDLPMRSYSVWVVGAWGLWSAERSFAGFTVKGTPVSRSFWNSGTGNIQNYDFGTFTGSDQLTLNSYDIKTWKQSDGNVTGGNLFYAIYPKGQRPQSPTFTNVALSWMENLTNPGDQKWGFQGANFNLLAGLSSGEYTIEFYSQVNGTYPNKSEYDNNGGNSTNYTAHFRYNYIRSKADGNWNTSASWLDEIVPDNAGVSVEINHIITLGENRSVNDLKILGGSLTLSPSVDFTAVGTVSSSLNEEGLVLQSNVASTASLLHSSPGVKATVGRYVSGGWGNWDEGWHIISTPVTGQAISGFATNGAGNGYDLYGWDEATNYWMNYKEGQGFINWNSNSANFNPGQGYLVSFEQTQTDKAFLGRINVGNILKQNLSHTSNKGKGWHLLGNPFSSALVWNDGNWALDKVAGNAKIWHSTQKSYSDIPPAGIIPSAQGFMVQVSDDVNSITIPAISRTHSSNPWFKSGNDGILLIAREVQGSAAQESRIRVNAEATDGYDFYHDSRFLPGYAPKFYSLVAGEQISTNTLPAISAQTIIPFGFVKNDADDFKIELLETIPNLEIFLTDLKLNIEHKLSDIPAYVFNSSLNDEPGRFLLHFGAVGIDDEFEGNKLVAWYSGKELFVKNTGGNILVLTYDIQGRLLKKDQLSVEGINLIPMNFPSGVYIINLIDDQTSQSVKVVVP